MSTFAKKIVPVYITVLMTIATITPGFAAHSHAGSKFSMLVYTRWGPSEVPLLQGLANQWAARNGGAVKVVRDSLASASAFKTLADSNRAPDMYVGLSDEYLGPYQRSGLLAPVPNGAFDPTTAIPAAVQSVTYGGKRYAAPLTFETYTLVYNKKLVPTPPKTFDGLIATALTFPNKKGGAVGFLYAATNLYFSYAFIRGFGGYVFKPTPNGLNVSDIGLDNAGTVAALSFVRGLVQKGVVPADADYNTAQTLFEQGKLGMFVDGSWNIAANRRALGRDFAAAPWPALPNGATPRSFVDVQVGFVNARSHQKDRAFSLLTYLASTVGIPDNRTTGRLPVRKADLAQAPFKTDQVISAYVTSALLGDPMPNVPEISQVWTPSYNNLSLVVTGKETPKAAADTMTKQIKAGIAAFGP